LGFNIAEEECVGFVKQCYLRQDKVKGEAR
jgi:hypothetical protein